MSKRRPLTSLEDLNASFPREHCGKKVEQRLRNTPVPQKHAEQKPVDIEDESALFLSAVAGTLDMSLKNPHVPADSPRAEPARKTSGVSGMDISDTKNTVPTDEERRTDRAAARKARRELPQIAELDDGGLFAKAMDGVAPIRARGRETTPPPKPAREPMADVAFMDDMLSAKLEFSLEYTDEYVQGHVLGFDPLILAKLRSGAYSPEGHIDLHGQNLEQAYAALAAFVRHSYHSGKRHVLVVTGRGKNSPGGTPVLRERVQAWFTREPFKRVVLAFCSAKPGDGGAGALYLLLRRRKKSQGKIIWDRTPSEEDLFY